MKALYIIMYMYMYMECYQSNGMHIGIVKPKMHHGDVMIIDTCRAASILARRCLIPILGLKVERHNIIIIIIIEQRCIHNTHDGIATNVP